MSHYLRKRSITLNQHNTSIALEEDFWIVIDYIAQHQHTTHTEFISKVDNKRPVDQTLSSALRLACLHWLTAHPNHGEAVRARLLDKITSLSPRL